MAWNHAPQPINGLAQDKFIFQCDCIRMPPDILQQFNSAMKPLCALPIKISLIKLQDLSIL